jgi:hypothetical protein
MKVAPVRFLYITIERLLSRHRLASDEVTLRTFSDLQHYVEHSTEALVQSLRGADSRARAFRHTQVKAAIRFCDVLSATIMPR